MKVRSVMVVVVVMIVSESSVGLVDTKAVRDELVLGVVGRLDDVLVLVLAIVEAIFVATPGTVPVSVLT